MLDNNFSFEKTVKFFEYDVTGRALILVYFSKKKNKIVRRILGVQYSPSYYHNSFLKKLKNQLIGDNSMILKMEEYF